MCTRFRPYSPEEIVTRDYLLNGTPDVVINLVDATNLERNLYLTTQILDLGVPVVVALNMMDLVEKSGDKIDVDAKLSKQLGCPIVRDHRPARQGHRQSSCRHRRQGRPRPASRAAARHAASTHEVEDALAQIEAHRGLGGAGQPEALVRHQAVRGRVADRSQALKLPAADPWRRSPPSARPWRTSWTTTPSPSSPASATTPSPTWSTACVKKARGHGMTTTQKIDRVVTNRMSGPPHFRRHHDAGVLHLACPPWAPCATDWANDGLFGDGWLYTGTEQYDEAVGEYEGQQAMIDAFLEAAEEDGVDVEGAVAFLEAEEPEEGDAEAAAEYDEAAAGFQDFLVAASAAGVQGTVEEEDEETGEVSLLPVTLSDFELAVDAEEPDPAEFGLWHPGVPVVMERAG